MQETNIMLAREAGATPNAVHAAGQWASHVELAAKPEPCRRACNDAAMTCIDRAMSNPEVCELSMQAEESFDSIYKLDVVNKRPHTLGNIKFVVAVMIVSCRHSSGTTGDNNLRKLAGRDMPGGKRVKPICGS